MTKRYLVTGGMGFLGSALARRLVAQGNFVRILDNQWRKNVTSPASLTSIDAHVEFIQGDIRDLDVVQKACEGITRICHFAFINGTQFFYSHPELVLEVGVAGMLNILKAATSHNIRELFVASSSEVYQMPEKIPTDETVPLIIPDVSNPRFSYAGGKILSELMAMNYGRKHFDRLVIFRPHNVYGPNMGWEHVIPQFVLRMLELSTKGKGAQPFTIQGSGQETRAFVYIDDFVSGLEKLLDHGKHLNIYHVGTMEEVSVSEVASLIAKILGKEISIMPGPLTQGSPLRRCPDISKLRALGYSPQIPLTAGLNTTVKWYVENADQKPS